MSAFLLLLFALVLAGACAMVMSRGQLMMGTGNTYGKIFRISTFGESHGLGVGVIVDGCPPRIPITAEIIQKELDKRRPGQSRLTTPRNEEDTVEIWSGTVDGMTSGTPIGLLVRNKDQKSQHYGDMEAKYRPSHADATYDAKYGVRSVAGGGRSSARETIGRVAAGAIAKQVLKMYSGVEIIAYVYSVQDIVCDKVDHETVTEEMVRIFCALLRIISHSLVSIFPTLTPLCIAIYFSLVALYVFLVALYFVSHIALALFSSLRSAFSLMRFASSLILRLLCSRRCALRSPCCVLLRLSYCARSSRCALRFP
jgi:hypothetical protein